MNLIELRDRLNEEIEKGRGHMPVLAISDYGLYEDSEDIEYNDCQQGYIIY